MSQENEKPRILYVIGSLEAGGTETHLNQIISNLPSDWSAFVFVHNRSNSHIHQHLSSKNIPILGPPKSKWLPRLVKPLITIWRLHRDIGHIKPTIIHMFLPESYLLGGLVTLFSHVPIKIMSRRSLNYYQQKNALYRYFGQIERWLHRRMNFVLGNSKAVMAQLKNEGVSDTQAKLIYNGVDLDPHLEAKANRAQKNIPEDALVITITANLIPYKGHLDLMQALSMIQAQLPASWLLICLGKDSGIGADLQQQAGRLGIKEHIRFVGSQSDVPEWLACSDIGILSSHTEGFSNAVLEYMAASLPVVATDVGGNSEAIIDGKHGRIVPSHAPEKLAQALLDLAQNPALRQTMGEQARLHAQKNFSVQVCIDQYDQLYRQAIVETKSLCADS